MANPSKAKGTTAETKVVRYLQQHGIKAKRKALSGNHDEGDIDVELGNGRHVTLEVKAGKQTANPNRAQLKEWMKQADIEGSNSDTVCYLVVVRYRRQLKDADVYLHLDDLARAHQYLDEFVKEHKYL